MIISWHIALRRTALIAAVFCSVVLALLGLNAVAARRSDPLLPAHLTHLQHELNRHPKNAALRAEVRRLDAQVRSGYFRHREFALRGFYLLLGGVALFLIASETARQCRPALPQPRPQAGEELLSATAFSQRSVLVSGALLFGVLCAVAVFSRHDGAEYAAVATQVQAKPKALATAPDSGTPAPPTTEATPVETTPAPQPAPSFAQPQLAPYPVATTPLPAPLQPLKVDKSPTPKPVAKPPSPTPTAIKLSVAKPPLEKPKPTVSALSPQPSALAPFVPENAATQWPRFRGPQGDGAATGAAPLKWDGKSGAGVLWKVPVPLEGWNSPVVWGEKIFLSGASKNARDVFCFATKDGALLWRKTVPLQSKSDTKISADTGFAPSTLATDGSRVAALFVNGDVACFDFDGKLLWQKSLGVPDNQYGHASSPIIYKNSLILQWDQGAPGDKKSALLALDISSGKQLWKTPRPVGSSWATPLIITRNGRDEIVTASDPLVIAHDAQSGHELWRMECLAGDVTPSPIWAGEAFIFCSPNSEVVALRPGDKSPLWRSNECTPDIVSPAASGSLVLLASSDGYVVALNSKDGSKAWDKNFTENFHASPLVAAGRFYLQGAEGTMRVIEASSGFKLLAENPLGEKVNASPALVNGRFYIRGEKHLFCIGGAP